MKSVGLLSFTLIASLMAGIAVFGADLRHNQPCSGVAC